MNRLLLALILFFSVTGVADADEIRPGYLELNTTDGNSYSVKWKAKYRAAAP